MSVFNYTTGMRPGPSYPHRLEDWLRAVLDLLAPPRCAGCARVGSSWCMVCRAATRLMGADGCETCGEICPDGVCGHCETYEARYKQALSYAAYREPFRRMVLRLKHSPDRGLGVTAAALAAPVIRAAGWPLSLALPVPLGEERFRKRGYNQVTMFGEPLSKTMGVSYRPDALRRTRETRSQVGLSGAQRRANLQAAFAADSGLVSGASILLLDDVFTTGSTANACADALYKSGASAVYVFTLARALPEAESRWGEPPVHVISNPLKEKNNV